MKQFISSEFGFHLSYQVPGGPGALSIRYVYDTLLASDFSMMGRVQIWDVKENFNEHLQLHTAVDAGSITYTLGGAGNFFDQLELA